jgi:hypothetical protein
MERYSFTISKFSVIVQKLVNPKSVLLCREEKSSDSNAVNFITALIDVCYDEIKDFLENNNDLFLKDLFLLENNILSCNQSKVKELFSVDSNDILEPFGKGNITEVLIKKLDFTLTMISKTKSSVVILLNK